MKIIKKKRGAVDAVIDFDPFDLRLPEGFKFKKGYEVPDRYVHIKPIDNQGDKLYKFGITDYTDIPQLLPYATRKDYLREVVNRASYYKVLNRKRDAFARKNPEATLEDVDKAHPDEYPFVSNTYKRALFVRISIDPRYMYLPLRERMSLAGFKTADGMIHRNIKTWFNPVTKKIENKILSSRVSLTEVKMKDLSWYNNAMTTHILPAMREERARVLEAMKSRDLSTVEYHRLVGALDVLNKNVNLGEGLPTANVSVVDQLSDAELAAMIASADDSVSADPVSDESAK